MAQELMAWATLATSKDSPTGVSSSTPTWLLLELSVIGFMIQVSCGTVFGCRESIVDQFRHRDSRTTAETELKYRM